MAFRDLFFVALCLFRLAYFCYWLYTCRRWTSFRWRATNGDAHGCPSISKSLPVRFIVPFGVGFPLPVALYLTTRMGWTNYQSLASKRKFVILGIFVLAAILTPPDVVSQLALGIPMILLYEIGVQVCRITKPRERE
jgi:sec-independent protein translocase protein TatC